MKKKIRSEITKLARQLIAEEASFDAARFKLRVGQLYEQLTVLNYLETQVEDTLGAEEPQSLDSKSFREENWFTEPVPVPQSQHKDELIEPLMEKIKDIVAQMPQESQRVDELLEEVLPKNSPNGPTGKHIKNDLEEFASSYQQTPTFERKEVETPSVPQGSKPVEAEDKPVSTLGNSVDNKTKSINDSINKGLNIGLNDRLAFIKYLFNNNADDYTRVLSQISTMNSYDQATTFIKTRIKPEYNYWLKKDMYSDRFMSIIEKSFN